MKPMCTSYGEECIYLFMTSVIIKGNEAFAELIYPFWASTVKPSEPQTMSSLMLGWQKEPIM